VLVLGGALLGFVPGLPEVRLDPEVVLVVFLPPLLYGSSSFANVNDFRGDLRWLALIPGLPWAAASVLGRSSRRPTRWPRRPSCAASVSPPPGQRGRGEGLFNDATALVADRVAVVAVVAGNVLAGPGRPAVRPRGGRRGGHRPGRACRSAIPTTSPWSCSRRPGRSLAD
jgi:monovalent cation/hydrogen antiporter